MSATTAAQPAPALNARQLRACWRQRLDRWRHRSGRPEAIYRLAAAAALGLLAHSASASEAAAVQVVLARVERTDLPVELRAIGTAQAYNTVTVKPLVGGQIVQVAFTEGQRVHRGTVLVRIDERPLTARLHEAQATQAKDAAQLQNLRVDLARLTTLAAKGLVARQSIDTQASEVAVLEAAIQGDAAAVENAQLQLGYATVASPIEGIAGLRMIDVGNVISTGDPGLVVITQIEPIAVVFAVPAEQAVGLELGRAGTVAVDAFNREDSARLAAGLLASIDNQIDPGTNTVRLKAVFPNTDHALKPGQFVHIHTVKTVLRGATTVPKSAIQRDDTGTFVYVARADSTVMTRRIVLGAVSGNLAVVAQGLTPGEQVVLEGQYGLRAGSRISVRNGSAQAGAVLAVP